MRADAMGEVHGVRLSNHLWPEISAQLLCATPTAHRLEYADWWHVVLKEPLRVETAWWGRQRNCRSLKASP
jgi:mandelate racemase